MSPSENRYRLTASIQLSILYILNITYVASAKWKKREQNQSERKWEKCFYSNRRTEWNVCNFYWYVSAVRSVWVGTASSKNVYSKTRKVIEHSCSMPLFVFFWILLFLHKDVSIFFPLCYRAKIVLNYVRFEYILRRFIRSEGNETKRERYKAFCQFHYNFRAGKIKSNFSFLFLCVERCFSTNGPTREKLICMPQEHKKAVE